jgi:hypothetical protein
MKKIIIASLLFLSLSCAPVFASAQTVNQDAVKQQLIQVIEALLVQIEAQLQQLLAQQAQNSAPVSQIQPSPAVSVPSTPISSIPFPMAGSTPVCYDNWQCNSFGSCVNGVQTRTCTDVDQCGNSNGEPATSQVCTTPVPVMCHIAGGPAYPCGSGF